MLHKLLAFMRSYDCAINGYTVEGGIATDVECLPLYYPTISTQKDLTFQVSLHHDTFLLAIPEELTINSLVLNRFPISPVKIPDIVNPLASTAYIDILYFDQEDMDWYTLTLKHLAKWAMENGY